jgi:hypothetical protein
MFRFDYGKRKRVQEQMKSSVVTGRSSPRTVRKALQHKLVESTNGLFHGDTDRQVGNKPLTNAPKHAHNPAVSPVVHA